MTDNDRDEFEPGMGFDDGEEEQPGEQRKGLAAVSDAWRRRPVFKLAVLMIGVAAVIAAVIGLTSQDETPDTSRVAAVPGLSEPPGGRATPAFLEAQKQASQQRIEKALESGGSAVPTPLGTGVNIEDLTRKEKEADPLAEFRSELEAQRRQHQEEMRQLQIVQQQQPPPQPPPPFDATLQNAMAQQMGQLIDAWKPKPIQVVQGMADKEAAASGGATQQQQGGVPGSAGGQASGPAPLAKNIVSAGTVSYAQLLTEANSDVQGPILAQILSGPLAGARAIGQFEIKRRYLVLTFTHATLKGKEYSIQALALNPDTTLGALATETDQRYFDRVVLPAAGAFIAAIGDGLGQPEETVTVAGNNIIVSRGKTSLKDGLYQGVGAAGQAVANFFQQEAQATKPLVRVAVGTPMGLFFTNSVTESGASPTPASTPASAQGRAPQYSGNGEATPPFNAAWTDGSGAGAAYDTGVYSPPKSGGGIKILRSGTLGSRATE